eukprot:CAMPEP_0175973428 /NCGR_PEP_ID=MMETSP0108-20121206/42793_1 /TAXON_ID=195067 ORGANISM="Goniomonas pacifica, Strain CCMP1869" /NCGR_SAMPLE_ID=MMETSP0108 /ASSEMBLY_ACC=CAM_ASM_000204 /LENGTH=58 /DNA_ID=CAMNT_0017302883 /DNA_START=142 /DNA_END=314 /DNA_ORIENTATION=+
MADFTECMLAADDQGQIGGVRLQELATVQNRTGDVHQIAARIVESPGFSSLTPMQAMV